MDKPRVIQIAQPDTGEEEWQALREPIMTGWLAQGSKVAAFEYAFAKRHGVKYGIATSSCTTALHLILAAIEVGPGDEVIVPAFTWVATANVVLYCGATPVFVDIDAQTYNIDPAQVASKVTSRTKAIIVVHLFGLCVDVDAVTAAVPDIPIIEDAACAAGGAYKQRPAGSLGLAAAFSFHPRKSITTGEGGMVTTSSDALAERVRMLRNHGASVSREQRDRHLLSEVNLLGFNYRMTDLQGALGLVQLRKLDRFVDERSMWATYYRERLDHLHWLRLPDEPPDGQQAWQAYVTYVDPDDAPMSRNEMMEWLQDKGVSTRPGTHAVHMLRYYRERFGLRDDDFPAARDCDRNAMALPLHNRMCSEDFEYVVQTLADLQ